MHTPFLHPDNFQRVKQQHLQEFYREADMRRLAHEAKAMPVSSSESGYQLSVLQVLRSKFQKSLTMPRLYGVSLSLRRS